MLKCIKSTRFLLYLLSILFLVSCGSSDNNIGKAKGSASSERPTVVSSDGALTMDTAEIEPQELSLSVETAIDVTSDELTSNEAVDEIPVSDEIDTIEELLAQLDEQSDVGQEDPLVVVPDDSVESVSSDSDNAAVDLNEGGSTTPDVGALDSAINSEDSQDLAIVVPDDIAVDGSNLVEGMVDMASTGNSVSESVESTVEPSTELSLGVVTDPSANPSADLSTDSGTDPSAAPRTELEEEPILEPIVVDSTIVELDTIATEDALQQNSSEHMQQDESQLESELGLDEETVSASFSSIKSDLVVDCNHQLPCTASQDSGAVSVVVENVYRHPETGRLAIALSVTGNRDTALRWDNDITSTDDVATTYNGTSREFSGFYQFDKNNDKVTLLGGTRLLVVQHFREMPSDTTVSIIRFDIGYIEAGERTAITYSNMPLDPVLGDVVDCNNLVPCSWIANDQSYSVNVLKTSGLWQTGRLRVDFEVRSTVGMGLNLFRSEPVVGNDGSVFTPRTHSLGGNSDYQKITVQFVPEGIQVGYQDFLKNANRQTTSIIQVRLGMTRVDAPGAGSPVFRNLPLE